jgi:solute:Na+ symporter, SSS family
MAMTTGAGTLGWLDWLVLAMYVALIAGAGVLVQWRGRRSSSATSADYFLAGRHMPVWAVAISTLATAQSAATFVGVPQDTFNGDLTYFMAILGSIPAAIIIALFFIPAYYRLGVSTPYQLLETRFGPGARLGTSVVYLLGRVFANGARIFVGAIPVTIALFGERSDMTMVLVITGFMVFAILYTLRGGLESVIWTDIVQVAVYMGAAMVAVVLLWKAIPASTGEVLTALQTGGKEGASKLRIVAHGLDSSKPLGMDLAAPFTLLTALTGWTLLYIAAFGTDQDLTQRLLACNSAKRGAWSTITSTLITIPTVAVFAVIGLLLWVLYARPDLMGRETPAYAAGDSADVFLKWVLHETPLGFAGLMIAGVLAAGPAGINASLNSMGSTLIADIYKPLRPGRSEAHYVAMGRWAVVAWGVVLGAMAILCIAWQRASGETIISFVLNVMAFAYAGLLGVFFTALFTRRGSTVSVIGAMVSGFVVVLALQPTIMPTWLGWLGWTELMRERLGGVVVAGPWRLVAGTVVATLVCLAGRPRNDRRVKTGASLGDAA